MRPLQQKAERDAQEREARGIPRCKADVPRSGAWEPHRCYKGAVKDDFCASHHPDKGMATLDRKIRHAVEFLTSLGYTVTKGAHDG